LLFYSFMACTDNGFLTYSVPKIATVSEDAREP
jgi:hypothetical protein